MNQMKVIESDRPELVSMKRCIRILDDQESALGTVKLLAVAMCEMLTDNTTEEAAALYLLAAQIRNRTEKMGYQRHQVWLSLKEIDRGGE